MTSLDGRRVAPITGGTTGIGRATALQMHDRGYAVVVTGNNPDTLTAARAEFPERISVVQADVSRLSDADLVAEQVLGRYQRLDAVFLNAGYGPMQSIGQIDEATFDRTFDINIKGNYFTLQRVLPTAARSW